MAISFQCVRTCSNFNLGAMVSWSWWRANWNSRQGLCTRGWPEIVAPGGNSRTKVNYSTLSHESVTCNRSPAISSTAFDTRPPGLPPASLMDTDFVVSCQLVRRRRPPIRFLSISPYLCSTLPSDPASRRRPCASLPFTSIRLGRDFHPLAAEHARRTSKPPPFENHKGWGTRRTSSPVNVSYTSFYE